MYFAKCSSPVSAMATAVQMLHNYNSAVNSSMYETIGNDLINSCALVTALF